MHRSRPHTSSILIGIAQAVLGVALLLTLLAGSFPLSTLASGPMCELSCCAGRAPHAAGSCMNGSCHAFAANHHTRNRNHEAKPEQLCGLSQLKLKASYIPSFETVTVDYTASDNQSANASSSTTSATASVATAAMTKTCQADCGGLLSRSAGSKRQRDEAALAYANRPRPPSPIKLRANDYRLTETLDARAGRGAPRGPPLLLS
jgi:hypothetical protein